MWLALRPYEIRRVGNLVGVIVVGMGIAMAVPLVVGIVMGERDPVLDYAIGGSVTLGIGLVLMTVTWLRWRPPAR